MKTLWAIPPSRSNLPVMWLSLSAMIIEGGEVPFEILLRWITVNLWMWFCVAHCTSLPLGKSAILRAIPNQQTPSNTIPCHWKGKKNMRTWSEGKEGRIIWLHINTVKGERQASIFKSYVLGSYIPCAQSQEPSYTNNSETPQRVPG